MDQFNLAPSDAAYFAVLNAKYHSEQIKPVIGINAIPSALLESQARERLLGVVDGKQLLDDEENIRVARSIDVRVLQLKGGLGTSFKRKETLKRLVGRDSLADKGTDSYFENISVQGFDAAGNPRMSKENISVAELKLLYYVHLIQEKLFHHIEVQELVNAESQEAVSRFWDTLYLADRVDERMASHKRRTYRQIFNFPAEGSAGVKGLSFNPHFIVQGVIPVIDAQTGQYLDNEALRSPGGHGAFVALMMEENAMNRRGLSVPQMSVFTNGDGVNNMLPPAVAGWMVRKKIPLVMVTTTKQLLDLKGGLIALLSNAPLPQEVQEKLKAFETLSMEDVLDVQTALSPYLLEIAQAKAAAQVDVFKKMGISIGVRGAQFFNTNLHAQNHTILDPFLADLKGVLGSERFLEIIGPDLVVNPKEKNVNGQKLAVLQLEGASGSALLALNRFVLTSTDPRVMALKEKHGIERVVYFVNFDEHLRSEVFTPEKYTWDHYLYGFSDLFRVDPQQGRLVFTPASGRSTLPGFDLDVPYEDMEYDINCFGRQWGVRELDYLGIRGEVRMPNAILKRAVFILNNSGRLVDLTTLLKPSASEDGRLVLDNVFITIDQNGHLATTTVGDLWEAISHFEKHPPRSPL